MIPKSVCFAVNVPRAVMLSPAMPTSAVTGITFVTPSMVTARRRLIRPVRASSESAANRMRGCLSTCSTSVRIAWVTFLISAVSGGVSTSRLSVETSSRSDDSGRPGT